MSLLLKLQYKKGFSNIEKEIADYIIEHKETIGDMRLVELAEATYTSTATISRFCRKLGKKTITVLKSILFRLFYRVIRQMSTTISRLKKTTVLLRLQIG